MRDIANPSGDDPFFPAWRHKDWYLGFSWASGVVTIEGKPYPNGRNEESSSESISAYEVSYNLIQRKKNNYLLLIFYEDHLLIKSSIGI